MSAITLRAHDVEGDYAFTSTTIFRSPTVKVIAEASDGTSDAYYIHRDTLVSTGGYFGGLLTGPWRENSTQEVTIKDVNKAAFSRLVAFLYCMDIPNENPAERIKDWILADRFQYKSYMESQIIWWWTYYIEDPNDVSGIYIPVHFDTLQMVLRDTMQGAKLRSVMAYAVFLGHLVRETVSIGEWASFLAEEPEFTYQISYMGIKHHMMNGLFMLDDFLCFDDNDYMRM
ncbi:MAG: hypothetical protein M1834_008265 [Cirrosporium novae-zelandiae]|nr:MAG: hypothetical protein M1834_008265 [Cirrosporium novae-zelandiae]